MAGKGSNVGIAGSNGKEATLRDAGIATPLDVAIIDGAGNHVTSFGGTGGTSATDDAAFTPGSGTGTPIMGMADEAAPDSVDEGDVGVVRMTLPRALHVNLRDATGAEVSVGGGTQYDEDTVSAAADKITMAGVVRKDTAATLVNADGDRTQMQVDANGRLHINASGVAVPVTDNSGSLTVDAPVGTPAFVRLSDGSAAITTLPVSLAAVPSHAVTNAGTFATQVDGSALTALQLIDDTVFADDAAFTPGTSKVSAIGAMADENTPDSVDEGDIGVPRMTLDRKLLVTVVPHTSGGWDVFSATSGDSLTALTSTAQAVKTSAGKLGGWYIYNPNATATYVIIYNVTQASVTVGTTNPKMVVCIPASSAANVEFVNGITFDTAISVAATTTGGGNTAPGAALEANFFYK